MKRKATNHATAVCRTLSESRSDRWVGSRLLWAKGAHEHNGLLFFRHQRTWIGRIEQLLGPVAFNHGLDRLRDRHNLLFDASAAEERKATLVREMMYNTCFNS